MKICIRLLCTKAHWQKFISYFPLYIYCFVTLYAGFPAMCWTLYGTISIQKSQHKKTANANHSSPQCIEAQSIITLAARSMPQSHTNSHNKSTPSLTASQNGKTYNVSTISRLSFALTITSDELKPAEIT